jgi:hypothetical protein
MDDNTCLTCNTPMRPRDASAASHPGTKRRSGPGRCITCAAHGYAPNIPDRPATLTIPAARAALNYWLDWRRNRGVPDDGWPA